MRFNVGETYYFIRIEFHQPENDFSPMFLPWVHELKTIVIHAMRCIEHHKVAWEHDPKEKLEHDGFVFQDDQGDLWASQYPTASFGQLDDSMNFKVRRHLPTDATEEQVNAILENHPDKETIFGITRAENFLEEILRAINPESRFGYMGDDAVEERAALEGFHAKVVAKLEEVSGRKVTVGPLKMRRPDGTDAVISHVKTVTLVEPKAAA